MVDRDRILAKLDEVATYVAELRSIAPQRFDDYLDPRTKRACERLLQIAIEAVVDVCAFLVTGLRLGLPTEENDLFEKLQRHGVVSEATATTLSRMRGFRNRLVHGYGGVVDQVVFDVIKDRLGDFEMFTREIVSFLRNS